MNESLKKYFTLAISIDCVVFGLDDEGLKVLLIERNEEPYEGFWALPGDLVDPQKVLNETVNEVLFGLSGLSNLSFEESKRAEDVNRHPLGRVISSSYYALIKISDYALNPASFAKKAKWFKLEDAGELAFDHNDILNFSVLQLQKSVRIKPIGFELLPKQFTLSELQALYENVLQMPLDARNFRKKINALKILKDLGMTQKNVAHRPAKLFSFDEKNYNNLKNTGFNFEL